MRGWKSRFATLNPSGPHHLASSFGSVNAAKTAARAAGRTRSISSTRLSALAAFAPPDRHAGHQGRAEHLLYAFLTTDANAEVAPVHPKAMPVLLRTAEEMDRWLTTPTEDALELQRPLPDGALEIVAVGRRENGPGSPE